MAEQHNPRNMPEQYEETEDPRNPPNSVLQPEVRRTARWTFLTPIVILTVVAALAWTYFFVRGPRPNQEVEAQGVTGTGGDSEAGGFNPDPTPGDTSDELKYRGAGSP